MQRTNIYHRRRRAIRAGVGAVAICAGLLAPAVVGASVSHTAAPTAARATRGIEVSMGDGAFGPYLVVGSGPFKGLSLYAITSDTASTFGCTTVVFHGPGGNAFPCTGPETDQTAEWPALTTAAAPIAGPGIDQAMLKSVFRKGIGHQVVYDGHPLYLFDQSPGQISGEGWDEGTLPPWHGSWWLINPTGTFEEGNQTLSAVQLPGGTSVLSALMIAGGGFYRFPLYTFSADTSASSSCANDCARIFEPLLTTGTPGIEGTGVHGSIGTITRTDGTVQVTYDGHPLYLYSLEGVEVLPGRGPVATGNGNNKTVGSGTFHLVTP
jgi:predicted lipoprotein with Yx(FWY)xxD motif